MIINNNFGDNDSSSVNVNVSGDLISGSVGDDILVSLDGNDTLDGKAGNDILAGKGGNDSLIGGLGDDTLTGGGVGFKNDKIFVTADTSGIDTLTGGAGEDIFVLGGKSTPELNSNSAAIVHYNEAGNDDRAIITDFDPREDTIMLGASKSDYSLVNLASSTELYFGDELVAIIEGNTQLSLDNSYFLFPGSDI